MARAARRSAGGPEEGRYLFKNGEAVGVVTLTPAPNGQFTVGGGGPQGFKFSGTLKADKNGVFQPLEDVAVKEGTEVDVYLRTEEKGNIGKRKKSVADYEAVGMWKDRDDIGTGVDYENRMRKYRK